jgi:hypothetical protein
MVMVSGIVVERLLWVNPEFRLVRHIGVDVEYVRQERFGDDRGRYATVVYLAIL